MQSARQHSKLIGDERMFKVFRLSQQCTLRFAQVAIEVHGAAIKLESDGSGNREGKMLAIKEFARAIVGLTLQRAGTRPAATSSGECLLE